MMGSGAYPGTSPVRNLGEAKRQAQSFADQLGLRVGELIQFENHYYVELLVHGGGRATEVLVDRAGRSRRYRPAGRRAAPPLPRSVCTMFQANSSCASASTTARGTATSVRAS